MKLADFYNQKKIPVTSVNNKVGDVVLNATDIGAISQKDIGILVPNLKNGIIPDTQLPKYAKLVNGKILSANIPTATNDRVGGIILGQGFEKKQNGVVDAIGTLTKQQKQQKIDIIQTEGNGDSVLANNGQYINIISDTRTRIQFSQLDSQNNAIFDGNLPIVCLLSQNNNYYILDSTDIVYNQNKTILHMTKFLIQQKLNKITTPWTAFVTSALKYVETEEKYNKCKNISFTQSLIYG